MRTSMDIWFDQSLYLLSLFLFEGSEENWRNDKYERGWTHGGRYETTIGRVSRITKCVGEIYGTRFETL